MADGIDPNLIGSVINALPIDKMIGTPLMAMLRAQVQASKQYADFIMTVGIKDGKAVMVAFDYDETLVDEKGNVTGVQRKTMRVPLLAIITHPNVNIEDGNVAFEVTISQSSSSSSSTEAQGGFEAKIGWGPFSVSVHGSASHKSEQTRKTDTRAKYSFSVNIKRDGPPEGMMQVLDFLTNAATKPVVLPANTTPKTDAASLAAVGTSDVPDPNAAATPASGGGKKKP
jgi:hypothetical protein